jgi:hypothetical protein
MPINPLRSFQLVKQIIDNINKTHLPNFTGQVAATEEHSIY